MKILKLTKRNTDDIVEVWHSKTNAGWCWHKKDNGNGEIISHGEVYSGLDAAVTGALRANPEVNYAKVIDRRENWYAVKNKKKGGWQRAASV